MTKVAINGFGRIGRLVARAILSRTDHDLELVSINDLGDAQSNALLFKRDSVHGNWAGEVSVDGDALVIDGKAPETLLDSYDAERAHGADENILNSSRSTDFITPKSEISRVRSATDTGCATNTAQARKR